MLVVDFVVEAVVVLLTAFDVVLVFRRVVALDVVIDVEVVLEVVAAVVVDDLAVVVVALLVEVVVCLVVLLGCGEVVTGGTAVLEEQGT